MHCSKSIVYFCINIDHYFFLFFYVTYVPIVVQNILDFLLMLVEPYPVYFEAMRQLGWLRHND
jgi:hypothetical protein